MTEQHTERPQISLRRPSSWTPPLIATAIVIAIGGLLGAPWAFSSMTHDGRREHMAEFMDFMIERALGRVDATESQQEEVLAIAGEARQALFALREGGLERRQEFIDQLVADPTDAARLEVLRGAQLADIEEASRVVVEALARIGEVLTPDQRQALADFHRERHHRWHH